MNESQFKKEKDGLVKDIEFILLQGRTLYDNKIKVENDHKDGKLGGFSYFSENRKNTKAQHEFEANCILIEKEFERLTAVAQYKHRVEPFKYTCHLIAGIFFSIIFVMFFVQMFVAGSLKFDGKQRSPWLATELELLMQSPNWSFLSAICFSFWGYYLFYATVIGNIKFGLRFFSMTFYPLVPKETFVSSFIVNAILMNFWMVALIYEIVELLR